MPTQPHQDKPAGQFRIVLQNIIGEERYRSAHIKAATARNWVLIYVRRYDLSPWEIDPIVAQAKRKFGLTVRPELNKSKERYEFRIINPVVHGGIQTMGW